MKVFVRVSPPPNVVGTLGQQLHGGYTQRGVITVGDDRKVVYCPEPDLSNILSFRFDGAFDELAAVTTAYQTAVLPLVHAALGGQSSAAVVCGEDAYGKAMLMEGKPGELIPGFISLAAESVFSGLEHGTDASNDHVKVVRVSWFELAKGGARDLLGEASGVSSGTLAGDKLTLRDDPRVGVTLPHLLEVEVKSPSDVGELIRSLRRTGYGVPGAPHRALSVFTITIEGMRVRAFHDRASASPRSPRTDASGGDRARMSFITLPEVAGSSTKVDDVPAWVRGLHTVLEGMENRSPTIPFHRMRATLLLRDALVGRIPSAMVAVVSPSIDAAAASGATLKFASRVLAVTGRGDDRAAAEEEDGADGAGMGPGAVGGGDGDDGNDDADDAAWARAHERARGHRSSTTKYHRGRRGSDGGGGGGGDVDSGGAGFEAPPSPDGGGRYSRAGRPPPPPPPPPAGSTRSNARSHARLNARPASSAALSRASSRRSAGGGGDSGHPTSPHNTLTHRAVSAVSPHPSGHVTVSGDYKPMSGRSTEGLMALTPRRASALSAAAGDGAGARGRTGSSDTDDDMSEHAGVVWTRTDSFARRSVTGSLGRHDSVATEVFRVGHRPGGSSPRAGAGSGSSDGGGSPRAAGHATTATATGAAATPPPVPASASASASASVANTASHHDEGAGGGSGGNATGSGGGHTAAAAAAAAVGFPADPLGRAEAIASRMAALSSQGDESAKWFTAMLSALEVSRQETRELRAREEEHQHSMGQLHQECNHLREQLDLAVAELDAARRAKVTPAHFVRDRSVSCCLVS